MSPSASSSSGRGSTSSTSRCSRHTNACLHLQNTSFPSSPSTADNNSVSLSLSLSLFLFFCCFFSHLFAAFLSSSSCEGVETAVEKPGYCFSLCFEFARNVVHHVDISTKRVLDRIEMKIENWRNGEEVKGHVTLEERTPVMEWRRAANQRNQLQNERSLSCPRLSL